MIAIIGAGPAGLAAAITIASKGQQVTVLDSQARGGGQYWRHIEEVYGYKSSRSRKYLKEITTNSLITHISGAQVWSAEIVKEGIQLNYLHQGEEKKFIIYDGFACPLKMFSRNPRLHLTVRNN